MKAKLLVLLLAVVMLTFVPVPAEAGPIRKVGKATITTAKAVRQRVRCVREKVCGFLKRVIS